jgi:hypothetical protein
MRSGSTKEWTISATAPGYLESTYIVAGDSGQNYLTPPLMLYSEPATYYCETNLLEFQITDSSGLDVSSDFTVSYMDPMFTSDPSEWLGTLTIKSISGEPGTYTFSPSWV